MQFKHVLGDLERFFLKPNRRGKHSRSVLQFRLLENLTNHFWKVKLNSVQASSRFC